MPNEKEEIIGALRNLSSFRLRDIRSLFDIFFFWFFISCLTEWKTFHLYDFDHVLKLCVRSFGEVVLYGIVMVPCMAVVWLLLLKVLTLDSHKLGFRLGSLFGPHANIDQTS